MYKKREYETYKMFIWRYLWHIFCKLQYYCGHKFHKEFIKHIKNKKQEV